jgi:hypothetical protein
VLDSSANLIALGGYMINTIIVLLLFPVITFAAIPPDYQSMKAKEKLDILWKDNILPTAYETYPPIDSLGLFDIIALMNKRFLQKSFDHTSDEMPEGRLKLIHPFGAVAKIKYIADQRASTSGILKTGGIGLARLSLAGNPSLLGYTPGMAIKFLIDGKPSINLHVMNSLSGQGDDHNFFALPFSNIIPDPPFHLFLLAQAFSRVKKPPTELNVNGITSVQTNGRNLAIDEVQPVYQLVFVPNPELAMDADTDVDFRFDLEQIDEGALLYTVYAKDTKDSELRRVGKLMSASKFVSSQYADENLFFQHQR